MYQSRPQTAGKQPGPKGRAAVGEVGDDITEAAMKEARSARFAREFANRGNHEPQKKRAMPHSGKVKTADGVKLTPVIGLMKQVRYLLGLTQGGFNHTQMRAAEAAVRTGLELDERQQAEVQELRKEIERQREKGGGGEIQQPAPTGKTEKRKRVARRHKSSGGDQGERK